MMAEFAITPEVLDPNPHPDREQWLECIRSLVSEMFPRTAASAVMVSNLHAGSWEHEAKRIVDGLTDPRTRVPNHPSLGHVCSLFDKLRDVLVMRPGHSDYPEGETEWCREAVASHATLPIERILCTRQACGLLATECSNLRGLDEVTGGGFWSGISSQAYPKKILSDQVSLLRKLCVHSSFLCIVNPYVFGGDSGELDFVESVIRSALNRPPGFESAEYEIHTRAPESDVPIDDAIENRRFNIESTLRRLNAPGVRSNSIFGPP